jgi:hypothetical protein
MAKKPTAPRKKKFQEETLPVTSAAARLGAEDAPAAAGFAETAAMRAGPPEMVDLADLMAFKPPPLPHQPAAAMALADGAGLRAFRVAAAASSLPAVPITYDPGRESWLLLSDYSYGYQGYTLTAKAGFAFDLASVPRPLWWLIAPNELSIVAPLFHDLLYTYQGRLREYGEVAPDRSYTRREADDLFLHLMEVEGIARWRRYTAYAAVRAAGGIYWAT